MDKVTIEELTDTEILDFVRENLTFLRDEDDNELLLCSVGCDVYGDVDGHIFGNIHGVYHGNWHQQNTQQPLENKAMKRITDTEILDFVRENLTLYKDEGSDIVIAEVRCNIEGPVFGDVFGDVDGHVFGDIHGCFFSPNRTYNNHQQWATLRVSL